MPLRFLISNFWKFYSDKTLLAVSVLGIVIVYIAAQDMRYLTSVVILAVAAIALCATIITYLRDKTRGGAHIDNSDISFIYLCKYRVFWRYFRVYTILERNSRPEPPHRIRLSNGENYFACFIKMKNGYYHPYAAHWSALNFYQSGEITMFENWGTARKVELSILFTKHSASLHELGVHTSTIGSGHLARPNIDDRCATVGVYSSI